MLSLPAPYAWDGGGIHISLEVVDQTPEHETIRSILRDLSSHRPSEDKIVSCLQNSGVFQCYVQPGWILNHRKVNRDINRMGLHIFILHPIPDEYVNCFDEDVIKS